MKDYLQRMGRSLMLPVSVLPAAALLVGVGNWFCVCQVVSRNRLETFGFAGNGLLGQLALLFAVGLALGMVQKGSWCSCTSSCCGVRIACQFISAQEYHQRCWTSNWAQINPAFDALVTNNVLFGIIQVLLAAAMYNRFSEVRSTLLWPLVVYVRYRLLQLS